MHEKTLLSSQLYHGHVDADAAGNVADSNRNCLRRARRARRAPARAREARR